jgi:hypothetical protein
MKNGPIIVGLLIALVVGGGAVYTFLFSQKGPAEITTETAKPEAVVKSPATAKADCKAAAAVVPLVNLTTGMGMTTAIAACE